MDKILELPYHEVNKFDIAEKTNNNVITDMKIQDEPRKKYSEKEQDQAQIKSELILSTQDNATEESDIKNDISVKKSCFYLKNNLKKSISLNDLGNLAYEEYLFWLKDTNFPRIKACRKSPANDIYFSLPILPMPAVYKPVHVNLNNVSKTENYNAAMADSVCVEKIKTSLTDKVINPHSIYQMRSLQNDIPEISFHKDVNDSISNSDEKSSINTVTLIKSNINNINLPNNETNSNQEIVIGNAIPSIKPSNERLVEPVSTSNGSKVITTCTDKQLIDSRVERSVTSFPQLETTITKSLSQPTLANDSRLVRISLPSNPMNIIQSNTQFINKSRNFLNFITEKSTNIMEKALLPQHLTLRYNTVLKSENRPYNDKKYASNDYVSTESLSENLSNLESDGTTNFVNSSDFLNYTVTNIDEGNDSRVKNILNHKNESVKYQQKSNLLSNSTSMYEALLRENIDSVHTEYKVQIDAKTNEDSCLTPRSESDCFTHVEIDSEMHDYKPTLGGTFELEQKCQKDFIDSMNNSLKDMKHPLLRHPLHLTLLNDYTNLKADNLRLLERVESLEKRNSIRETEKNEESKIQIALLEKTVDRLTSELQTSLSVQETLKREHSAANKEMESMVMKYAVSEKQLIETQRARDCAERKLKNIINEHELLQGKLRQLQGERSRICNILDGKCREVTDLQKENEKLKEDVQMKEVKLKWTQNRLKTEMESQKETQQKLDKSQSKINEMKEECDQIRKETQEAIRKFQQSEENKAVTLDQQLKEQQARLILERHVTEDKEMSRLQLQKEVETLKNREQILIEENNTLFLKIQDLENGRLNYENNISHLKSIVEQSQTKIIDLQEKISELDALKLLLQQKEEYFASTKNEIENLRLINSELQSDMCACRQREADMLDFTQKLTDKNVQLQSEFTTLEGKAKQLENEQGPLHEHVNALKNKVKLLEENITQEKKRRIEECEILAKHVAEQTQIAQNLAQELEDSQGENAVLRRKRQISIQEMTRELQQCRKRLELFEVSSPSNSLDVASRTGSNTSLNAGDVLNGALSDNSTNSEHTIHATEPSKQVLIDRIIKLQKINVKRAEKLDFLKEHTETLVEELQKKTKIIQNYILCENSGVMSSNERDQNKAELARHGGIMASVYNHRVSDHNMTLELSLEINQKLQAVLEDTLLKNITLKDNLDTLGEEIARLTMQNQ